MDWDVFISHAWEDKEDIAGPLAEALRRKGLRVWYDEFTLTLGDSLRRSIDRGLAQSRYGVVILSPHFFAKEWPQKELDGLAAREDGSGKVILPIWHNVTREEVSRFSPTLADRLAVSTAKGLDAVVEEILRALGEEHRLGSHPPVVKPTLAKPRWSVNWKIVGAIAVAAVAVAVGVILLAGRGPKATPTLGDTRTRPTDGMVMVYVPGGTLQMGSDEGDPYADDDEFPQHPVTLDSFWIDRTEVANAQFAAFLNEQGNQTEGGVTWLALEDEDCPIERVDGEYRPKSGYADYPVFEVSWYGAAAYCRWGGGRLPTEAEWEYAARGTEGRIYPWGNEFDCAGGNLRDSYTGCDDGYDLTAPVGQFPDGASWCGTLDMAGNVWEWVYDWRGSYFSEAQVNPTGPPEGKSKVLRGSWCEPKQTDGRAAHRDSRTPDTRSNIVGFRCARGSEWALSPLSTTISRRFGGNPRLTQTLIGLRHRL
jgi:formylglycine-generating enzyme required for sulfatase activity